MWVQHNTTQYNRVQHNKVQHNVQHWAYKYEFRKWSFMGHNRLCSLLFSPCLHECVCIWLQMGYTQAGFVVVSLWFFDVYPYNNNNKKEQKRNRKSQKPHQKVYLFCCACVRVPHKKQLMVGYITTRMTVLCGCWAKIIVGMVFGLMILLRNHQ